MVRRSLACLVMVVACKAGGPPAPIAPHTPAGPVAAPPPPWLADYARELAPGARAPLWPALPAGARAVIEGSLGGDTRLAGAARLAAATRRLRDWALEAATPADELAASVTTALEGLRLAEPLAFAEPATAETYQAMGLLYHFYAVFDRPDVAAWVRSGPNVPGDRDALIQIVRAAPGMRTYFASQLLAHGNPPDVIAPVLGELGQRALAGGSYPRARDLFRERIARRGREATAEDWLDASEAHVRLDERELAAAALAQARTLAAARAGDRHLAGLMLRGERQLATLERLRTATGIERYDLLRGLGRREDAGAVLAPLRAERPRDARVAMRVAIRDVDYQLDADPFGAAVAMDSALADQTFSDADATYWSTRVIVRATVAMRDIYQLEHDVARKQALTDALAALHRLTAQLAKLDPGRAAAMDFGFDHLLAHLVDGDITSGLDDRLGDALALRAKYPASPEIDQLLYMVATFESDHARALAAVLQPPRAAPADAPDLYRKRARAAVTLAIVLATPDAIAGARRAVDDIPPSEDRDVEGVHDALLGDCDVLEALAGNAGAWDRARDHYRAGRAAQHERARLYNNLAMLAQRDAPGQAGDASKGFRDAIEALQIANDLASVWLPAMNDALGGPAAARATDLAQLGSLASGGTEDHKPPVALQVWLAATDAAGSAAAARDALGRLGPHDRKLVVGRRGLEAVGTFQFSLGLASTSFYQFELAGYASIWLTPPWPLDRAGLEAKAGPAKPGAKPGKQRSPNRPLPRLTTGH